MLKAYLDNNIVSAIAKDDTATESDALDALMKAYDAGRVKLVTSELTLNEIAKLSGSNRRPVERMFHLLNKVPMVRWDELLGINNYSDLFTSISSPIIQNAPLYDGLLKVGLKTIDAQHVFVAAKQGCDVFLTCDGGVLAKSERIRDLCAGLAVWKPSAFIASEGW